MKALLYRINDFMRIVSEMYIIENRHTTIIIKITKKKGWLKSSTTKVQLG